MFSSYLHISHPLHPLEKKFEKASVAEGSNTKFSFTDTEAWNAWLKVWNGQSMLTIVPMVTAKAGETPPGGMQLWTSAVRITCSGRY